MKFSLVVLVALLASLSPSVYGEETDVVRVFDRKLQISTEKMMAYLKEADLERYGFTRTEEISTETDEDGNVRRKKTIYYRVTDDCDKVMFWEGVLKKRLPKELRNSNLLKTTVKEVQSRIIGRKTESCTVGLEIHPNQCANGRSGHRLSKRGKAKGWCGLICIICFRAGIKYSS